MNERTQELPQPVEAFTASLRDIPDVGNSWWRYFTALMRAVNRERAEFNDSVIIAAQIALQAAKDNPLSLLETLEVMEHKQELITRGLFATREKMAEFMWDQTEEGGTPSPTQSSTPMERT